MTRKITTFSLVAILLLINPMTTNAYDKSIRLATPSANLTAGVTSEFLKILEEEPQIEVEETEIELVESQNILDISSDFIYSAKRFKRLGVVYYGGYKYTYYSDLVLPGGGLKIPGRHYDENGYICDEDGYICGASQMHSKGTVLDSPFGKKVKIYDWCDIQSIDIYVHWKT